MKNIFLVVFIAFLFLGCRNSILNYALESRGVFKDHVRLVKLPFKDKTIVFIPMHHVGTKTYYDDVASKIDSLKKENFFFYYEKLSNQSINDTVFIKFRKMLGSPIPKKGYMKFIDSAYSGIKFKKSLIDQPTYEILGLDSKNSVNGDATIENLIQKYESTYGKITLTKCDFDTSIFEKYGKCKEENRISKKNSDKVVVDARNEVLFNNIKNSSYEKVGIIFGSAHLDGLENLINK